MFGSFRAGSISSFWLIQGRLDLKCLVHLGMLNAIFLVHLGQTLTLTMFSGSSHSYVWLIDGRLSDFAHILLIFMAH